MLMLFPATDPGMLTVTSTDRVTGCYWKPNAAFIEQLADFLQGKKVLEIFAGNGYLAGHLAQRGIDVIATTVYAGHDAHDLGFYHPVHDMEASDAVEAYGGARDVLLVCWPTVTNAVLRAALQWGTDRDVVYIGEMTDYEKNHLAGCATDVFFEAIRVTHRFDAYRGNSMEHAVVCRVDT